MKIAITDGPLHMSRLRTSVEVNVAVRGFYFVHKHKNHFNTFQDDSKNFINKLLLNDWWEDYWAGY